MEAFQDIKNKAYQVIGRNLLLVQQLERQFKTLRYLSMFSGPLQKMAEAREVEWKRISTLTMGAVVKELKGTLWSAEEVSRSQSAPDSGSGVFSFNIRFESSEFRIESTKAMEELVAERNVFAHNLASTLSVDEPDSWLALCELQADYQRRLIERVGYYQKLIRAIYSGLEEQARFLKSESGKRLLDQQFISQSALALALVGIWQGRKRDDGWLLLSTAGSILQRQLPEEFAKLKALYGAKSLSEFVLKSDLFELAAETADGEMRNIIRVKPEVVQAIADASS